MMPAQVPLDDAQLVAACGEAPGTVCEAVWDATGNETLAKISDWFIGRPLTIVIVFAVAWILARLARRAVRKTIYRVVATDREAAGRALQRVGVGSGVSKVQDPRRAGRAESISAVMSSTVSVLIWVVALFVVLGELGINLAPLIASAGIAGVALGFGAQSLVKDCITGLFMLIEDQYGIGDVVDLGEATGVVERISLRTTVLRSQDGTVWHVPNGEVLRVGNRSQLWSVAVLDVLIAADADVTTARQVLHETAAALCSDPDYAGDVLEAPEVLGVESVAAEGITLRLLVKTLPGSQFRLQRALRESLKQALEAAGVESPPAVRSVWTRLTPSDPSRTTGQSGPNTG